MTHEQKGPGGALDYLSYLLRLWREKDGATTRWRASLQDPLSGQRVGFAHLDELVVYLRERTGLALPAGSLVEGESTTEMGSKSREGESE
jgi:hypothetical protein